MYGAKIRVIREMRGLSQENVADELHISQSTYSLYESNKVGISAEMLEKIADVLSVTPADLMNQQPIIYIQHNQGTQAGYVNEIVSSPPDRYKELYEEIIASKNAEIERLQKIVEKFLSEK